MRLIREIAALLNRGDENVAQRLANFVGGRAHFRRFGGHLFDLMHGLHLIEEGERLADESGRRCIDRWLRTRGGGSRCGCCSGAGFLRVVIAHDFRYGVSELVDAAFEALGAFGCAADERRHFLNRVQQSFVEREETLEAITLREQILLPGARR